MLADARSVQEELTTAHREQQLAGSRIPGLGGFAHCTPEAERGLPKPPSQDMGLFVWATSLIMGETKNGFSYIANKTLLLAAKGRGTLCLSS